MKIFQSYITDVPPPTFMVHRINENLDSLDYIFIADMRLV